MQEILGTDDDRFAAWGCLFVIIGLVDGFLLNDVDIIVGSSLFDNGLALFDLDRFEGVNKFSDCVFSDSRDDRLGAF